MGENFPVSSFPVPACDLLALMCNRQRTCFWSVVRVDELCLSEEKTNIIMSYIAKIRGVGSLCEARVFGSFLVEFSQRHTGCGRRGFFTVMCESVQVKF